MWLLAAADQSETPCAVGKAVALYLSRVVPNSTIDHLVQEVAQQLRCVAGCAAAGRGRSGVCYEEL